VAGVESDGEDHAIDDWAHQQMECEGDEIHHCLVGVASRTGKFADCRFEDAEEKQPAPPTSFRCSRLGDPTRRLA
jgi:hypothetical protein